VTSSAKDLARAFWTRSDGTIFFFFLFSQIVQFFCLNLAYRPSSSKKDYRVALLPRDWKVGMSIPKHRRNEFLFWLPTFSFWFVSLFSSSHCEREINKERKKESRRESLVIRKWHRGRECPHFSSIDRIKSESFFFFLFFEKIIRLYIYIRLRFKSLCRPFFSSQSRQNVYVYRHGGVVVFQRKTKKIFVITKHTHKRERERRSCWVIYVD
jgi:hypothetical protein